MSKSVKLRRGTSLEHEQFAGAEGELTVDITLDTVRVHDGATLGGFPLLNTTKNAEVTAAEFKANKILYKNSYTSLADFPSASAYPGMVAYSQQEAGAYISNGTAWTGFIQQANLDAAGFVTNAVNTSNTGSDYTLVAAKSGTNLVFKTIRAGDNITVAQDDTSITLTGRTYGAANALDASGAYGVFKNLSNNVFNFKSIRPGSGLVMSASQSDAEINIDTVLKKAFNSVVVGATTIQTSAGDNILTFTANTGVNVTANATTKTVDIGLTIGGTNNVSQTGSNVFAGYNNGIFNFNKIKSGTGITVSTGANGEIIVNNNFSGTVTGAANLSPPSPTSLGLYKRDDAGVLKFYNISAGSNITITYSDDNNLQISAATGGAAGVGTVQTGTAGTLAYYPSTGTAVGELTGAYWDGDAGKLVTDIIGTVSSLSNHSTSNLAEGTNLYWTQDRFNTAFGGKSSADLAEGGLSLYFTDERAQDAVSTMLLNGNPNITTVTATTTAVATSVATITVPSTSGITVGMTVTGAGVPLGVTVQSVPNSTTFTVSPAIYAPQGFSVTLTGGTTLILNTSAPSTSTATLAVASSTGVVANMNVQGAGILGTVTVQSVPNATTIIVSPGYSVTTGTGIALSFATPTTSGVIGTYADNLNTFTMKLDTNYLGTQIRNAISVISGQGLTYDNVSGRFSLSGAVTSVNGYSGAVVLNVSDITGAAPSANPIFTGTPRAPTPTNASSNLQIATKEYVDAAKLAVTGSPLSGLATIQALGNAINGDTLFFQTVNTAINTKLSSGGGTMTGPLNLTYTIDGSSPGTVAVTKSYVDLRSTVQTVNTKYGDVVLNTDDIFERDTPAPAHLWFTNSRARSAFSASSTDTDIFSYTVSTGTFNYTTPNTDKITEGSVNQYFTAARARQSVGINVTGNSNFASYNSTSGVFTINATTDNLSQGTSNKFYTDTLARAAISLTPSSIQTSFLTYNDLTGQFTINPRTGNITESAGGPYFYTNARVYAAISANVTQLDNVTATNSFTFNNTTGAFTFNANTNNITEGTTNQYYTNARARAALSLSTTDATVLTYDNSTGLITFVKPTTDKIVEGSTNLYYTNARARAATSVTVTSTTGQTISNALTYNSTTGVYTLNANIDNMADGATNKFASIARVAGIISLSVTNNNGVTPGNFLAYNSTTGAFTFNNSTDSLTEGTVNKWASDSTVRSKITVTNTTPVTGVSQSPLRYGGTSGIAGSNAVSAGVMDLSFYTTPSIIWTPTANGTSTYHLATAQDITTSGKPKFVYVTRAINPTSGRLAISGGEVSFDCTKGTYHEVNRDGNITTWSFTGVPAAGNYFEIVIMFYNNVGAATFSNSNSAVKYAGAAIPTPSTTVGRRDMFKLCTVDGGTTWFETARSLNIG